MFYGFVNLHDAPDTIRMSIAYVFLYMAIHLFVPFVSANQLDISDEFS